MLSRREKLLVQPWEDRRFKDHKSKVKSALPAIDDRAPAARPHVALKLKKSQREAERAHRIQRDNFSLLQRLGAIMRHNRLDNHWRKPLPNFHKKVGKFFDSASIRERVCARAQPSPPQSCGSGARCYACEYRKMKSKEAFELAYENDDSIDLPPINMYSKWTLVSLKARLSQKNVIPFPRESNTSIQAKSRASSSYL